MRKEIMEYRVYGDVDGNGIDEYVAAHSAQEAADQMRKWYDGNIEILEVSRVMKGWK